MTNFQQVYKQIQGALQPVASGQERVLVCVE